MMMKTFDQVKLFGYLDKNALEYVYIKDIKSLFKTKYSDKDLLDFFKDYIKKSLNEGKISEKRIAKVIDLMKQIIGYTDIEKIGVILLENIKNLKQDYLRFVEQTGLEYSSILTDLTKLDEGIKIEKVELDDCKKIKTEESIDTNYEKEIENLQKSQKITQEQIRKYKEKIARQEQKEKDLKKELQIRETEISNNRLLIRNLSEDLENKNSEIATLKQEIIRLETEKNRIEQELTESYQKLREEMQKLAESYEIMVSNSEEEKKKIKSIVEQAIIKNLFEGNLKLYKLLEKLQKDGLDISYEELYSILQSLQFKMNILSKMGPNGPEYFLGSLNTYKNMSYDILLGQKNYIDIMFISDMHIKNCYKDRLLAYDSVIDYCISHDIKKIINLGDFLDLFALDQERTYENYQRMLKIIEQLMQDLSSVKGLYHFILGGNHDEDLKTMKIDLMNYFIEGREDFISLGYEKARICFKNDNAVIGSIILAHPHEFLDRNSLVIKKSRLTSGFIQKDEKSYDFFYLGHSHESYLDFNERVCVLPSLTMDRIMNGALHVRFYFDEHRIIYQEFQNLIFQDQVLGAGSHTRKLVPVTKSVYHQ